MYLERTNYYAKPGQADRVLQIRRRASEVRVGLGLPPGKILEKQTAADEGPDVQWECGFATVEAHEADLAARAQSQDFEAVRQKMGGAIDRFERHVLRSVAIAETAWVRQVALDGVPIVPQEVRFASGPHELKGYLYVPPGDGPFACMVTNHGSTVDQGTSDVCRPSVAATLLSWGIASFLPHRRGYGNSPGPAWRQDVTAPHGSDDYDAQLVRRLDRESDDVLAALDFLGTRPDIHKDHIGVMGSSFGGINTLLAAAKSDRFRCAVEFAGAAMNWERTPGLREAMISAARSLTRPIFFIQAENDYSTAPTRELNAALDGAKTVVEARIYPAFGLTADEGHVFERTGTMIWSPDVRAFLERWL
jgi:dienelactone hydrolase